MPDNNKPIQSHRANIYRAEHDQAPERPAPENIANLENELRSRAKQQEALAQLGERALVEPDLERLLNDAVSTVALTLAVDFVKILELLPGDGELLLRAGFGWKSDLVGTILTTSGPNSFARFTLDPPSRSSSRISPAKSDSRCRPM